MTADLYILFYMWLIAQRRAFLSQGKWPPLAVGNEVRRRRLCLNARRAVVKVERLIR